MFPHTSTLKRQILDVALIPTLLEVLAKEKADLAVLTYEQNLLEMLQEQSTYPTLYELGIRDNAAKQAKMLEAIRKLEKDVAKLGGGE